VVAGVGLLPVEVTLSLAACSMILLGVITVREAYATIDWPVIVLIGAMVSLGAAIDAAGGAEFIAAGILAHGGSVSPVAMLALILVLNMILSDVLKNEAQMVLMAPIAIAVARGMGVSPDPFLIAVVVGGSSAFLTPVGHQANVLVLESGGYRFGDYWRLGVPLSLLIVAAGVPLILWLWPL
jgi:di/tricarboxylate transporter